MLTENNKMAETQAPELDNMEEVSEGSNAVTKNAKPAEKIDTSKGGAKKVIHVDQFGSMEDAAGTKNAGKSTSGDVSVEGDRKSVV